jgi:hypothetical protein
LRVCTGYFLFFPVGLLALLGAVPSDFAFGATFEFGVDWEVGVALVAFVAGRRGWLVCARRKET